MTSFFKAPVLWLLLLPVLAAVGPSVLRAEGEEAADEQIDQPTPFSAWLDLRRPVRSREGFPIWLESVEFQDKRAEDQGITGRTIRLRFRRFPAINQMLLVRLQFRDVGGREPVVNAWSETGGATFLSKSLGSGSGLDRMERLTLPMDGVDYLEITAPGDGSNLQSVYLSSMKETTVAASVDFLDETPDFLDPFGGAIERTEPEDRDEALMGRVRAPLLDHEVVITKEEGAAALEFELESAPMLAVVELELLNVNPERPPTLEANRFKVGPLSLDLPDLADPAYYGVSRPLQQGVDLHYSGWIKATAVIPSRMLQSGVNRLTLRIAGDEETFVVRKVNLQLKYNASTFEYDLAPHPLH